jgi:glycosyl transferase family 25
MNRSLFAKRFDTYVISLERTPQRLEQFLDLNRAAGIDIKTFAAVDGRNIGPATIDPAVADPRMFTGRFGSVVAAAMSHRALWQRCAAGSRPFLIFEDDTAIRADIRTALPDLVERLGDGWDLLCVGHNADTLVMVEIGAGIRMRYGFPYESLSALQLINFTATRESVGVARLLGFFGLCAYLISPVGAKTLLDNAFPLDNTVITFSSVRGRALTSLSLDIKASRCLPQMKAFTCLPPLALPSSDIAVSAKVLTLARAPV